MKKPLHIASIIGVLLFFSCSYDTPDVTTDNNTLTLKEGVIEIAENTNKKGLLKLMVSPGFYGPTNVNAMTIVTYTLIPSQAILNEIPVENIRYRIAFEKAENTSYPYEFTQIAYWEDISNSETVPFPVTANQSYTIWRVTYEISNLYQSNFKRYKKYVSVDNDS